MTWVQVTRPDTTAQDAAGWCLRHTQKVYHAPAMYPTARVAWDNQIGRRFDPIPANVSVPVWFDHWGTYGGITANFGHVVAWVPGRGYYSSPGWGYGGQWFKNIGEIERYFNAKYLGWSTHMNGKQIVRWVASSAKPKPTPAPKPTPTTNKVQEDVLDIKTIFRDDKRYRDEWMIAHPDFGKELRGDQKRTNGNTTVFKGFIVTTSPGIGKNWMRVYGAGAGVAHASLGRNDYINAQSEARRIATEIGR